MPASVAPPPEVEAPSGASKIARPGAIYGLRLRAILVGLPLVCGLSLVSVYADMVAKNIQFGVLQLAPPAVAALFALALANRFLSKLFKRELLSRADILIIYSMLLVTVMVSTRGAIERIIPPLAYLPYYATPENKLFEQITQHIPGWALPFVPTPNLVRPDYMANFYEGGPVPWLKWIAPLTAWFGLYACAVLVFACMATLLRRQWMDNEQIRFPLTTLPLAIIQDNVEGEPFFSNRLMWAGFAFAAIVFGVNGLAANFPDWPKFTLDLWMSAWFTERPWNGMDSMAVYISLAAIGFAYFLPTDLLFSLWFFFLLTRFQDVVAVQLGGIPTGIGTHNARVWTGYQAAGAYFTLALVQFRIGWPYFKQVWKTAVGPQDKKPLDDSSRTNELPRRADWPIWRLRGHYYLAEFGRHESGGRIGLHGHLFVRGGLYYDARRVRSWTFDDRNQFPAQSFNWPCLSRARFGAEQFGDDVGAAFSVRARLAWNVAFALDGQSKNGGRPARQAAFDAVSFCSGCCGGLCRSQLFHAEIFLR